MNKTFNKMGFWFKKNAPTIMTITGIASVTAAAGIIGYISYKKLPKIIEEHKANLEIAKADVEPDQAVKASVQVYGKTALSLVKTYALPVALLGAGITCIVGSDKIQTQRLNQVSAALALTGAAYDELKKRVGNAIGEDKLNDILVGADPNKKEKEIELVNPETGEIEKMKVKECDGTGSLSMYSMHFNKVNPLSGERCNPNSKGEYFYDNWFCGRVESMLVDKVRTRGEGTILWLSEIYKELGATVENGSITKEQELASRVVGFKYDPDKPMFSFKRMDKYVTYQDHPVVEIYVDFIGLDGNLYNKTYDDVMVQNF